MKLNNIFECLSGSIVKVSEAETINEYTLKSRISGLIVDAMRLQAALELISKRDSFTLVFSPAGSELSIALSNAANESVRNFAEQLATWSTAFSQAEGEITLRINKRPVNSTLSIYSLSLFSIYLNFGTPTQIIDRVLSLSRLAYYLECGELSVVHQTGLLVFGPKTAQGFYPKNPEPSYKSKHLELRGKACTIYSHIQLNLVPNDFRLNSPLPIEGLNALFRGLELIFCLAQLCDISRFDSSGDIAFTIKGYTTETVSIDSISSLDTTSLDQYSDICSWAYTDGNIVDKLGICRNLISIHKTGDDLLKLKSGCLESIASNHAIYLKDNLKQYVDVKNKLSEQIQKGSEKASDVAKTINGYLRASIFSLCSFLLTAFLVRALSKSTSVDSPLIGPGIYWLFLLVMFVSLAVLVYAVSETNAELARYKKTYDSFRQRYSDLLSAQDLTRIFDNDSDFKRDVSYIKKSRKKAVALWLVTLAIIFVIISYVRWQGF